jgi:hypothetical protein
MFDKAREWMNNNSPVVTVASVVILICAIAFLVMRTQRRGPGAPGQAWYYDTVSSEYFQDKTTRIAPFKRENGNVAVRAHFFTCGECTVKTKEEGGERFLGYFEKYTDEMRAKLQENSESFALYDMAFQGRLYSVDGKTWVAAESEKGTKITSDLQQNCPPKSLRYCPPE